MGAPPATLEVWALPLDPALDAYSLAWVALPRTMTPGSPWTVVVGTPAKPAVVVVRLVGESGAAGRTAPAAVLAGRDADGSLEVTQLPVASPRDDLLLRRSPASVRVALRPLDAPGSLEVVVAAGDPSPAIGAAVTDAEGTPGQHSILVRTLSADADHEAAPTGALDVLPGDGPGAARLWLSGLPAGVRLVMAGLVPQDGGPADPATLSLAWIAVRAISKVGTAPD